VTTVTPIRARQASIFLPYDLSRSFYKQNIGFILCSITFEIKLPSACSFIVDGLALFCQCSHYMFRPTWPSSGVYDIFLFIPEGFCFAVFCCLCCMLYYAVSNLCLFLLRFVAQTRQTTRKSEKTKHAHMKMEINGNATKTNTN
jgi:hypothetical protein